jgi:hypothetical protein
MMQFQTACPKCGEVVTADWGHTARQIKCPSCNTTIVVPASAIESERTSPLHDRPEARETAEPEAEAKPVPSAVRGPALSVVLMWLAALGFVAILVGVAVLWRNESVLRAERDAIEAAGTYTGWYRLSFCLDLACPQSELKKYLKSEMPPAPPGVLVGEAPVRLTIENGKFSVATRNETQVFEGTVELENVGSALKAQRRWSLRTEAGPLVRLFLPNTPDDLAAFITIRPTGPKQLKGDIIVELHEGPKRLAVLVFEPTGPPPGTR